MANKWKNVADTCALSEKKILCKYSVTSCGRGEGGGAAAAAAGGVVNQGEIVV